MISPFGIPAPKRMPASGLRPLIRKVKIKVKIAALTMETHANRIFIKSPKEILKLGDTVKAKIIKTEGGRISLSIKALMEDEPGQDDGTYDIPDEYRAGNSSGSVSADESPFAKLLKDIKL